MNGLHISSLRAALGDIDLLVEDLQVNPGDRMVVFGPNGAGKSTLLRRLAGTLAGGPRIAAAYLPQRPWVFRGTARRNLLLGLDDAGAVRAESLANEMGLGDLLESPARGLSGGERQRLALARTLARPELVVLLDEPLSAIDARDRPMVTASILSALDGRTAMIVTHDRNEAAMLGDQMAVLVAGRVHQVGPVGDVLRLPADEEVASVLGITNALAGEISRQDGALVAVSAAGIDLWGLGAGAPGDGAVAMFGAEAVTVYIGDDAPTGSARNHWTGPVRAVRPVGLLVEVVANVGVPVAALLTPGSMEALSIEIGSVVTLAVKATAVRVVVR